MPMQVLYKRPMNQKTQQEYDQQTTSKETGPPTNWRTKSKNSSTWPKDGLWVYFCFLGGTGITNTWMNNPWKNNILGAINFIQLTKLETCKKICVIAQNRRDEMIFYENFLNNNYIDTQNLQLYSDKKTFQEKIILPKFISAALKWEGGVTTLSEGKPCLKPQSLTLL